MRIISCSRLLVGQRFTGWLSTGEGKWAVALKCLIRLGCLVQRLTVYTVAPFAYCTGQPTCMQTSVKSSLSCHARLRVAEAEVVEQVELGVWQEQVRSAGL